jgi:PiT family inorganic phosphate transporter
MPDAQTLLLLLTIAVALLFDFTNGFHDTANAIGTAVGTRAMTPRVAVAFSAVLNLVGAVVTTQLLHTEVANTVGSLVAPAGGVALSMLIAVLFGAITWNLITWRAGLPSSSSHALIGALIGMGLVVYGTGAIQWAEVYPVVVALLTSPIAGLVLAYVVTVLLLNLFRKARPSQANGAFRKLQLFSSGFVAFSHGANDAQKTMAIITLALFSSGNLGEFAVPLWVALAASLAIGLGTWAGGWRIIRTMGTRIIRMDPVHGFAAQTVAASVIQLATMWGLPVSTTQVVSGSLTIEAGPVAVTLAVLVLGGVLLALLVRQRRRRQPSVDAVIGSMEGAAAAGEGVSPNGDARKSDRDGGRRVAAGVAAPDKSRRDGR